MTKRTKPVQAFRLIDNLTGADEALREIAKAKREQELIKLALEENIEKLKKKAKEEANIFQAEIDFLGNSLIIFGDLKKEELFVKTKSQTLTFGKIGFQASTTLKNKAKNPWKNILTWLIENNHEDCIIQKPEINKEVLKRKSKDFIDKAGCVLVSTDAFFYETNNLDTL